MRTVILFLLLLAPCFIIANDVGLTRSVNTDQTITCTYAPCISVDTLFAPDLSTRMEVLFKSADFVARERVICAPIEQESNIFRNSMDKYRGVFRTFNLQSPVYLIGRKYHPVTCYDAVRYHLPLILGCFRS